ncbi:MAG: DUF4149 domain-containing protein [Elainellaceae cyanobacterium]
MTQQWTPPNGNRAAATDATAAAVSDAPNWQRVILATAILWLGGSLVLDLIVMPTLYTAGMMTDPSFTPMGSTLFSSFNHVEVISAALLLTATLALYRQTLKAGVLAITFAVMLFGISLFYTYGLTPDMIATGAQLNLLKTAGIPHSMDVMHGEYFGLELVKLGLVVGLMRLSQR